MAIIYLGIGSNIEAEKNIEQALAELGDIFTDLIISPVYQCPAFGFAGDDFLNLVVKAETDLTAEQVFAELRKIEFQFGRPQDAKKYSSRTLDIDLLMYDDFAGEILGYQLPRSDIERFDFVLKPLSDIAPELTHPVLNQTMAQLWQAMSASADVELEQAELLSCSSLDL